jgi:hypothetical protein
VITRLLPSAGVILLAVSVFLDTVTPSHALDLRAFNEQAKKELNQRGYNVLSGTLPMLAENVSSQRSVVAWSGDAGLTNIAGLKDGGQPGSIWLDDTSDKSEPFARLRELPKKNVSSPVTPSHALDLRAFDEQAKKELHQRGYNVLSGTLPMLAENVSSQRSVVAWSGDAGLTNVAGLKDGGQPGSIWLDDTSDKSGPFARLKELRKKNVSSQRSVVAGSDDAGLTNIAGLKEGGQPGSIWLDDTSDKSGLFARLMELKRGDATSGLYILR